MKASLLESPVTIGITIWTHTEQNPYTAELIAILNGMQTMSSGLGRFQLSRQIYIITNNQSALRAIKNPRHQSGQDQIRQIYETNRELQGSGYVVQGI